MYHLTDEQIDHILDDIASKGIVTEDLQNNLLDHVCCILEETLLPGDDFAFHYQNTIRRFYKNELKELEDETAYLLTFKNYYAMKKTMLLSGIVSASVFALGAFFKLMYWPGAGIMITLAIVVFALLFLPLVFIIKAKEVNTGLERLTVFLGTLLAIMFSLDILFTLQHWPNATAMWFATILLSTFIFIPIYFLSGIRRPETKVNTIITTIVLIGFTGLMFSIVAIRPKPNYDVYAYWQSEQTLRTLEKSGGAEMLSSTAGGTIWNLAATIKRTLTGKQKVASLEDVQRIQNNVSYPDIEKMFEQLQAALDTYNRDTAYRDHPISYRETLLGLSYNNTIKTHKIAVLNAMTQLQIELMINEMHTDHTIAAVH